MTACRTLLALYGLSLAFGALCALVIANRILMAADAQHARERLGRHKAYEYPQDAMAWSVN